jgi:hypothetical protein
MELFKYLDSVSRLIAWLSIKRVALATLFAFSALVLYTSYEDRVIIINTFSNKIVEDEAPFIVSPPMQTKIQTLVLRDPRIVSIVVWDANLRLNQRTVVYNFADDPVVADAWAKIFQEHGTSQTIFNTDDKNNLQMISLVNGDFKCFPYADTFNARFVPSGSTKINAECRISLPPYYGEFGGYLSLGLTKLPTGYELEEFTSIGKTLANEIFFKDVIKR